MAPKARKATKAAKAAKAAKSAEALELEALRKKQVLFSPELTPEALRSGFYLF